MTTVPVYDTDSMAIIAGQVDRIRDEIEKSKGKITALEGENPFGTMTGPDGGTNGGSEGVKGALGSFQDGVHAEFDAASGHMAAASDFLRRAAGLITETDQVAGENITVHENGEDWA